jgi:hypothetical protein
MTSLTTGLGMLPIALGLGEGGKILQPLGIAVCGGLWFSTLLTLYVVPALQYHYLKRKEITMRQAVFVNNETTNLALNLSFEDKKYVSNDLANELSKNLTLDSRKEFEL